MKGVTGWKPKCPTSFYTSCLCTVGCITWIPSDTSYTLSNAVITTVWKVRSLSTVSCKCQNSHTFNSAKENLVNIRHRKVAFLWLESRQSCINNKLLHLAVYFTSRHHIQKPCNRVWYHISFPKHTSLLRKLPVKNYISYFNRRAERKMCRTQSTQCVLARKMIRVMSAYWRITWQMEEKQQNP